MQLEPQACSAIAACADLLAAFERASSKQASAAQDFHKLCVADTCQVSKLAWNGFSNAFALNSTKEDISYLASTSQSDSSSSSDRDFSFFESTEVLLEALTFFNGNCLQSSRSNLDRIYSMRSSGDRKVDGADIAAREWRSLRHIRHSMLVETLAATASRFQKEVIYNP